MMSDLVAMKTPPPRPSLSFLNAVYEGGKISLLPTEGSSQDSVPIIMSGWTVSQKTWNSEVLFRIDWKFMTAALRGLLCVRSLGGGFGTWLVGVEVATGEPTELPGLVQGLESDVGKEKQLEVSKTIELNKLELKFGRPQLQQIHDTLGWLIAS